LTPLESQEPFVLETPHANYHGCQEVVTKAIWPYFSILCGIIPTNKPKSKGGDDENMNNNLENGRYLSGQEGKALPYVVGGLFLLSLVAFYAGHKRDLAWDKNANEFVFPQGARVLLESKTNRNTFLVYEGQKEPKCTGDIEKVERMYDRNGTFRGVNAKCKPDLTEPSK
jgi:hypothetical protein